MPASVGNAFRAAPPRRQPEDPARAQDIVTVNTGGNHVVTDHEIAHTWSQVFVTATANVRLAREQREASHDRVDHAVSDGDVAALSCEESPDPLRESKLLTKVLRPSLLNDLKVP